MNQEILDLSYIDDAKEVIEKLRVKFKENFEEYDLDFNDDMIEKLLISQNMTCENMSNALAIGVKNGYDVEFQKSILEDILTKMFG